MNPSAFASVGSQQRAYRATSCHLPLGTTRREDRRGAGEGRPPGSSRLCGNAECGPRSSVGPMETEQVNPVMFQK